MKRIIRLSAVVFILLATLGFTTQSQAGLKPDLHILSMSISPTVPTQGEPVRVRIKIGNIGLKKARNFRVVWFAGENMHMHNRVWHVGQLKPLHMANLEAVFQGYRMPHNSVTALAVIDDRNNVDERREGNNSKRKTLRVVRADSGSSPGSGSTGKPDIRITELSLSPSVPVQGRPVTVRVKVVNRGDADAGSFRVRWWPGENYTRPGRTWSINRMPRGSGMILTHRYEGYPSWYSRLITKVAADIGNNVSETSEANNVRRMQIRVRKP